MIDQFKLHIEDVLRYRDEAQACAKSLRAALQDAITGPKEIDPLRIADLNAKLRSTDASLIALNLELEARKNEMQTYIQTEKARLEAATQVLNTLSF